MADQKSITAYVSPTVYEELRVLAFLERGSRASMLKRLLEQEIATAKLDGRLPLNHEQEKAA